MLSRWDTKVEDLNLFLARLREIAKRVFSYKRKGRGRLIGLKEFDKKSLRGAEVRLSEMVCKERIDRSVIAYWENKEEILLTVKQIIAIAGAMLDRLLSSLSSFVDSTKFTDWKTEEAELFVCNRIARGTVYPVGISFNNENVALPVDEAVPKGNGLLYGDAWFDDNKTMEFYSRKAILQLSVQIRTDGGATTEKRQESSDKSPSFIDFFVWGYIFFNKEQ